MCEQLRKTAMDLETTATNAQNKKEKDNMETVKKKLEALKVAVSNYHDYLEEVDV